VICKRAICERAMAFGMTGLKRVMLGMSVCDAVV
jgi:hypothetical protein